MRKSVLLICFLLVPAVAQAQNPQKIVTDWLKHGEVHPCLDGRAIADLWFTNEVLLENSTPKDVAKYERKHPLPNRCQLDQGRLVRPNRVMILWSTAPHATVDGTTVGGFVARGAVFAVDSDGTVQAVHTAWCQWGLLYRHPYVYVYKHLVKALDKPIKSSGGDRLGGKGKGH